MATKKTEVGRKQKKTNLTLPVEVIELLIHLPLQKRKAYAKRLSEAGWTYQSIADVIGVTRQAVQLYCIQDLDVSQVADLPIPELPSVPIYKSQIVEAEAEAIAKLKELHKVAKLVRGKSQKHRAEADEFTRLAWEQVQKGITIYSLAKSLGVTPASLSFRFVRYGYMKGNGKSKVYQTIKYNVGVKENE